MIGITENHTRRPLADDSTYYNGGCTHRAHGGNGPVLREQSSSVSCEVVGTPYPR
jgi:hypothetical protein